LPHIGTLNSIKAPIGSEAVWLKWILAKMVQNEGIFRSFEANSQPIERERAGKGTILGHLQPIPLLARQLLEPHSR